MLQFTGHLCSCVMALSQYLQQLSVSADPDVGAAINYGTVPAKAPCSCAALCSCPYRQTPSALQRR